ncbi:MAG: hypothetical protein KIT40_10575 [Nitrospira sp.]|nr:hypothetical protein [Nitrospira sp.]
MDASLTRLSAIVIILVCLFDTVGAEEAAIVQKQQHGGVAVEFQFEPQQPPASSPKNPVGPPQGIASFRFTDSVSGRAYEGLRPAAWMVARRSQQVADELSCEEKARQFASGSLGSRADIDLNAYRLVTINQDNTVAFINPFVSLQNSKLESIVQLPSRGYDWALVPASHRLLVSLREADMVAVIDTDLRRLMGVISFETGSRPTRLVPDPDGRRLWVGLDGRDEVAVVDPTASVELARVPVGRGLHTFAVADDLAWIFVTNTEDDTVSVLDRRRQAKIADVHVGKTPVAMAWSAMAKRLLVAGLNGNTLDIVDPERGQVVAQVPLAQGIVALGLFDQGRYAFAVNQLQSRVTLLDLASATVKGSIAVATKPDHIAFTREFAYVRGQGTANISVINLGEARQGRLQAVAVPIGQSPPQDAPESINIAGIMAAAPEGDGLYVANGPDRILYRYVEGLMVPAGSFSNYRRMARGLLVLDTSLFEQRPGLFAAPASFPFGGEYDVIVKSVRPTVTACFAVTVAGPLRRPHTAGVAKTVSVTLERVTSPNHGSDRSVHLRLSDRNGQPVDGVRDGVLLALQLQSRWQRRVPIHDRGAGQYEAHLIFPESGEVELLVAIPSQGVEFTAGHLGQVSASSNISAVEIKGENKGAPHAER